MFSVTTNTCFSVNYENGCKDKIKSAYMQIFFYFFSILCTFFIHIIRFACTEGRFVTSMNSECHKKGGCRGNPP